MINTNQNIHPNLINAFGGLDKYLDLPILELPDVKLDYIDYIRPSDMKYPIMRGVDYFQRNFVVFRLIYTRTNVVEKLTSVIFQRYTNDTYCATASYPPGDHETFFSGIISPETCNRIKLLLAGEKVKNTNMHMGKIGTYVLSN